MIISAFVTGNGGQFMVPLTVLVMKHRLLWRNLGPMGKTGALASDLVRSAWTEKQSPEPGGAVCIVGPEDCGSLNELTGHDVRPTDSNRMTRNVQTQSPTEHIWPVGERLFVRMLQPNETVETKAAAAVQWGATDSASLLPSSSIKRFDEKWLALVPPFHCSQIDLALFRANTAIKETTGCVVQQSAAWLAMAAQNPFATGQSIKRRELQQMKKTDTCIVRKRVANAGASQLIDSWRNRRSGRSPSQVFWQPTWNKVS